MTGRRDDAHGAGIDALLRALAEAESRIDAPRHLEAAVMAAWDEHQVRRPLRPAARLSRVAMPAAAALLVAAGLSRLGQELKTASPSEPQAAVLLVGEPILPHERIRVVRMRVPASSLAALGVRAIDIGAESVDLDVVVGEDGVARGIRIGM